jgi:hypothetical protein
MSKLIKHLSATPVLHPQSQDGPTGEPVERELALKQNKATFFFRLVSCTFVLHISYIMIVVHRFVCLLNLPSRPVIGFLQSGPKKHDAASGAAMRMAIRLPSGAHPVYLCIPRNKFRATTTVDDTLHSSVIQ